MNAFRDLLFVLSMVGVVLITLAHIVSFYLFIAIVFGFYTGPELLGWFIQYRWLWVWAIPISLLSLIAIYYPPATGILAYDYTGHHVQIKRTVAKTIRGALGIIVVLTVLALIAFAARRLLPVQAIT